MRAPDARRAGPAGLAIAVLATAALAQANVGAPAASDPATVDDAAASDPVTVDDAAAPDAEPTPIAIDSRPLTAPARAPLDVQFSARLHAARRAHDQVTTKLSERQDILDHRVRAAYKLLRGYDSPLAITPEHRLAVARSRATARWLLARDRDEVVQLADEADRLAHALAGLDDDLAEVGAVPPIRLARPVPGAIVRPFGTLVHDDSHATLSRRGVDFDAAHGDLARAPADGVVRYAGPIRGLDRGVVIDHGGLWTVVGKLGTLEVTTGANVARGDALGHPARRRVYLEVRVPVGPGGTPVDPAPTLE
jgi:murein DD-endopeptidase MepM/ murein hydrolase activator NlpD